MRKRLFLGLLLLHYYSVLSKSSQTGNTEEDASNSDLFLMNNMDVESKGLKLRRRDKIKFTPYESKRTHCHISGSALNDEKITFETIVTDESNLNMEYLENEIGNLKPEDTGTYRSIECVDDIGEENATNQEDEHDNINETDYIYNIESINNNKEEEEMNVIYMETINILNIVEISTDWNVIDVVENNAEYSEKLKEALSKDSIKQKNLTLSESVDNNNSSSVYSFSNPSYKGNKTSFRTTFMKKEKDITHSNISEEESTNFYLKYIDSINKLTANSIAENTGCSSLNGNNTLVPEELIHPTLCLIPKDEIPHGSKLNKENFSNTQFNIFQAVKLICAKNRFEAKTLNQILESFYKMIRSKKNSETIQGFETEQSKKSALRCWLKCLEKKDPPNLISLDKCTSPFEILNSKEFLRSTMTLLTLLDNASLLNDRICVLKKIAKKKLKLAKYFSEPFIVKDYISKWHDLYSELSLSDEKPVFLWKMHIMKFICNMKGTNMPTVIQLENLIGELLKALVELKNKNEIIKRILDKLSSNPTESLEKLYESDMNNTLKLLNRIFYRVDKIKKIIVELIKEQCIHEMNFSCFLFYMYGGLLLQRIAVEQPVDFKCGSFCDMFENILKTVYRFMVSYDVSTFSEESLDMNKRASVRNAKLFSLVSFHSYVNLIQLTLMRIQIIYYYVIKSMNHYLHCSDSIKSRELLIVPHFYICEFGRLFSLLSGFFSSLDEGREHLKFMFRFYDASSFINDTTKILQVTLLGIHTKTLVNEEEHAEKCKIYFDDIRKRYVSSLFDLI